MYELTKLIREDLKPALGVTEPGAVAFAAASAREHVQGEIRKVRVALNSGMYKNAFTCGIPNSSNYGNLYAAALGAVAADAGKGLESLADITPEDDRKAEEMVTEGLVEVVMDHIGSGITIDATVETKQDRCTVHIRDSHTHIVSIEKNGRRIYGDEAYPASGREYGLPVDPEQETPVIHRYSLGEILTYIREVPAEEIAFIRDAFSMNLKLLEEGIASGRAVIAKQLLKENGGVMISEDPLGTAQLLCSGAIEARVLGLGSPAMSITGSGAHGIIASMPLYAWYKVRGQKAAASGRTGAMTEAAAVHGRCAEPEKALDSIAAGAVSEESAAYGRCAEPEKALDSIAAGAVSEESAAYGRCAGLEKSPVSAGEEAKPDEALLLRATALSYLITMYIKEYSGRLSAFCGCGIAAGTGMACGLAFLQGADESVIAAVIRNMASGLTGMICDGGNHGCAMKGIVAVDAAFRAVSMAKAGASIESIHGINGVTPEDTMRYMGMIASPGMVQTEKTIVEIMEEKAENSE